MNPKHTSQCGRDALGQSVASETLEAPVQMDNHASFPFFSLSPRRSSERGFAVQQRCHGNTVCISQWAIPELPPLDWNSDSPLSTDQPAKVIVYLWPLTERHYGCVSVKSKAEQDGAKENSNENQKFLRQLLWNYILSFLYVEIDDLKVSHEHQECSDSLSTWPAPPFCVASQGSIEAVSLSQTGPARTKSPFTLTLTELLPGQPVERNPLQWMITLLYGWKTRSNAVHMELDQ